jgi:hypothetical protein
MAVTKRLLRKIHRVVVPFLTLPLLITAVTGVLFQIAVLSDQADQFLWLLDLHRGLFGTINLAMIYPLLNGSGLLVLIVTGVLMWLGFPPRKQTSNRN